MPGFLYDRGSSKRARGFEWTSAEQLDTRRRASSSPFPSSRRTPLSTRPERQAERGKPRRRRSPHEEFFRWGEGDIEIKGSAAHVNSRGRSGILKRRTRGSLGFPRGKARRPSHTLRFYPSPISAH